MTATATVEKPLARRRSPRPKLVPPRYGTPRNPSRATYGGEVGKIAKRLGKPLMPWQQHAADVALEIDPVTGELWYEEVIITVPRQSGKTTLILAILVWRCITMALRLGPQTCTYIAQSGKMARRKLEREFARMILRRAKTFTEIAQLSRAHPTADDEWKLSMNNGSEHIAFGTDSYLQIEAPTETGSHGDVLDTSIIDEAFAREDDAVEQATDAATVTRRSPQSYIVSTAGNRKSRYLARKVIAGRKCIRDPRSRTCYLEWSVPDDARFDDPKVWAKYLPALGHTITVARLMARLDKAVRNPDEADEEGFEPGVAGFRRGYLNQWPEWPSFGGEAEVRPEIKPDAFRALAVDDDEEAPELVDPIVLGVGVSHGGTMASISVAGVNSNGVAQVETIERAEGTWWIEKRMRDLVEQWEPAAIAWDHGGPTRMVAPDIQRASAVGDKRAELRQLVGREWVAACEAIKQRVIEKRLTHLGDVHLSDAVEIAERQDAGDGWRWNLKGARGDISALLAATAALRALELLSQAEQPVAPGYYGS